MVDNPIREAAHALFKVELQEFQSVKKTEVQKVTSDFAKRMGGVGFSGAEITCHIDVVTQSYKAFVKTYFTHLKERMSDLKDPQAWLDINEKLMPLFKSSWKTEEQNILQNNRFKKIETGDMILQVLNQKRLDIYSLIEDLFSLETNIAKIHSIEINEAEKTAVLNMEITRSQFLKAIYDRCKSPVPIGRVLTSEIKESLKIDDEDFDVILHQLTADSLVSIISLGGHIGLTMVGIRTVESLIKGERIDNSIQSSFMQFVISGSGDVVMGNKTDNKIKVSNSVVGSINTAEVEKINVAMEKIKIAGHEQLYDAFTKFTDAFLSSSELNVEMKEELAKLTAILSSEVSGHKKSSGLINMIAARIIEVISFSADLVTVWGPVAALLVSK